MYIAQPGTPAGAARSQRSRQCGAAAARSVKVTGIGHAQQGAIEWQAQQAVQRLAAGQQRLLIRLDGRQRQRVDLSDREWGGVGWSGEAESGIWVQVSVVTLRR